MLPPSLAPRGQRARRLGKPDGDVSIGVTLSGAVAVIAFWSFSAGKFLHDVLRQARMGKYNVAVLCCARFAYGLADSLIQCWA